jgi:SAM-dependent methyltransferase
MKEGTKQRLSAIARKMHVLPLVDHALFLNERFRNTRVNRRFADNHSDFPIPPADLMFEAFGHTNSETYFRTGDEHAQLVARLLSEHVHHSGPRVCEWGCGPGRIIRHLREQPGMKDAKLVGVDFNPRSIQWCQHNIPGVSFENNRLHPPLPFPNESFDFIYALSVFTHLDESGWTQWMQELVRVTAKGGAVLFTTHGQNYVSKLLPRERTAFLQGKPVYRTDTPRGKKLFAAYHPYEFVCTSLPAGFRIALHDASASRLALSQDVYVVVRDGASHRIERDSGKALANDGPTGAAHP